MNAERLLTHYEKIADAPDAIARLRRFILDLAVRGKLVPQDANDEPASELLKRIAKEKARLAKAGESKRADAEITEVLDPPFNPPIGWEWSTVSTIAYVEMGQSPPSEHYNQDALGIAFFQGKADFGARHPTSRYWCTQPTKLAERGDILISIRAPVGPTNVAVERCCIGRGLAALRPYAGVDREFMLFALNSFEAELEAMGFGTTFVAINKKQLTQFPLPLPPLAEQHRIVAKVDELMGLCDRLEAARASSERSRDRLAAASLARLNTPDPDTFQADARFALDALPAMTTRPDQIKTLRQTILNLAVRGKLVPQDPKDKPVRKAALDIVAKRRGQMREEIDEPFQVPERWAWRAVDTLADQVTDGEHATPPRIADAQIPLVTAKNVRDGFMDYSQTDWVSRATAEKAWGVVGLRSAIFCWSVSGQRQVA